VYPGRDVATVFDDGALARASDVSRCESSAASVLEEEARLRPRIHRNRGMRGL